MYVKKKRICLIGMEHGCGAAAELLTTERLIEVERWAQRGGFDAVALLHAVDGLCDSAASAKRTGRRLVEMKPKERDAWAESIAEQVQRRWGSDQVKEIVLLCGLCGYQELAQRLGTRIHSAGNSRRTCQGRGEAERLHRFYSRLGLGP